MNASTLNELHIEDEWLDALKAGGLDTFDALMTSERGRCFSMHDRGQTYRIELPDGRAVFLKRDTFTSLKDICEDTLHLRRSQPPCVVELAAIRHVARLGIPAPPPIAWGQRRRGPLAWRAVLVTGPLEGTPLSELLAAGMSDQAREAAMRAVGRTARKLYEAGLSWPDLAPKHFFLSQDGDTQPTGVLDLARMRPTRRALKRYLPKQVARFCGKLRLRGGADADERTFLDALGYEELLGRRGR